LESGISEATNFVNDPCSKLLGRGWRIPTKVEWEWVGITSGTAQAAFNSVLKLHYGGYIPYTNGSLSNRGGADGYGYYWSSMLNSLTDGESVFMKSSGNVQVSIKAKTSSMPLRCIRSVAATSLPLVSAVTYTSNADASTTLYATVSHDGGIHVKERGFCYSTTNSVPTTSDTKQSVDSDIGSFSLTKSLDMGTGYYARAYAINDNNVTTYSQSTLSFRNCPESFSKSHNTTQGAPVNTTITYKSIDISIGGTHHCWLMQNLGASNSPTLLTDNAADKIGWYFQFNRKQGYYYYGSNSLMPSSWNNTNDGGGSWSIANDPCRNLLQGSWRLPTQAEWIAIKATWSTAALINDGNPPLPALKLNTSGDLYLKTVGNYAVEYLGTRGYYWSSNENSASINYGYVFMVGTSSQSVSTLVERNAGSIRCITD
jgi:hypothetical protein